MQTMKKTNRKMMIPGDKEGMGRDDIAFLRAETWRAMEDAYRQGKTRE